MVKIVPIGAFTPKNPEILTTRPYDVIEDEVDELRKNGDSYVHVILPEGGEERHENGRKALQEFIRKGLLQKQEPAVYLYSQSNGSWSQRGLIGGFSLRDYGEGNIKKHEKTREKPLQDRIIHIETTGADTELVWLMVKSNAELKSIFDETEKGEPLLDFERYGWRNTLWKIPEDFEKKIIEIFGPLDIYIADGHHRVEASYQNMVKMNREKGAGPWDYIMAYVANDDEVRILPYNRVVRELPLPMDKFMEKIEKDFKVLEGSRPGRHEICMFSGKWHKLVPREIPEDAVDSLDTSILQNRLLEPVLGITDPRKDPNIFFIGGEQDLESYVKKGNTLVFSLHPTSVEEVEGVADAKRDMPPKSTWFDPKLLSGLVVYLFY